MLLSALNIKSPANLSSHSALRILLFKLKECQILHTASCIHSFLGFMLTFIWKLWHFINVGFFIKLIVWFFKSTMFSSSSSYEKAYKIQQNQCTFKQKLRMLRWMNVNVLCHQCMFPINEWCDLSNWGGWCLAQGHQDVWHGRELNL